MVILMPMMMMMITIIRAIISGSVSQAWFAVLGLGKPKTLKPKTFLSLPCTRGKEFEFLASFDGRDFVNDVAFSDR